MHLYHDIRLVVIQRSKTLRRCVFITAWNTLSAKLLNTATIGIQEIQNAVLVQIGVVVVHISLSDYDMTCEVRGIESRRTVLIMTPRLPTVPTHDFSQFIYQMNWLKSHTVLAISKI